MKSAAVNKNKSERLQHLAAWRTEQFGWGLTKRGLRLLPRWRTGSAHRTLNYPERLAVGRTCVVGSRTEPQVFWIRRKTFTIMLKTIHFRAWNATTGPNLLGWRSMMESDRTRDNVVTWTTLRVGDLRLIPLPSICVSEMSKSRSRNVAP
jgi:hypothetical protein